MRRYQPFRPFLGCLVSVLTLVQYASSSPVLELLRQRRVEFSPTDTPTAVPTTARSTVSGMTFWVR